MSDQGSFNSICTDGRRRVQRHNCTATRKLQQLSGRLKFAVAGVVTLLPTWAMAQSIPVGTAMWLRADAGLYSDYSDTVPVQNGASVTRWLDQSGNGHHATVSNNSPWLVSNGLNGMPTVRFDGNDAFSLVGQVISSQQFSIFTVVTDTGGSGGGHREVLSGWRTDNQLSSVFFGTTNGRTYRLSDQFLGGATLGSPATPFLFTGVSGPSSASVYQNVSTLGTRASPLPSRNLSTPWYVGKQGNYFGFEGWKGDIAEIVVYDRALSPAERDQVWGYLGAKYDIGGNTASVSLEAAGPFSIATVSNAQYLPSTQTTVRSLGILAGGSLTLRLGEQLSSMDGVAISSGGALSGSGSILGDATSEGTLRPANLTIDGNYIQTSGGQTLFSIGGYDKGVNYDSLHVTGAATLSGSVVASLASGFSPTDLSTFDLITADGGLTLNASSLSFTLPHGFSYTLANNGTTLQLTYGLSVERHYAGGTSGSWQSSSSWSDAFGVYQGGAPLPTLANDVFINRNSVKVSQAPAAAKSVLVNGGKLVIDGTAGASLHVAEHLELGNSLHVVAGDPTHTGAGQGYVVQNHGSQVTVDGDLIVGGQNSVYEISDTSRLDVKGSLALVGGSNALFHQKAGTVLIGSQFDGAGHSLNGLLDLGRNTTYEMDGGVLDVATIQQTGLFVFKGGTLFVKQMLINTTPAAATPTFTTAPAPVSSPPTPSAAVTTGSHISQAGGFTLERGIVVIDQYSDWQLTGANANLTIGANSAGGSNGNLVQAGGSITVDGSMVVGDGPDGKGSYAMSSGNLIVHGQVILGRNGGTGYFDQTGGSVTIDGQIDITESSNGSSKFNITGGTMRALALSIGSHGGAGELHIGPGAVVDVTQSVLIGEYGKVTGNGIFNISGASVTNLGVIEPGNSPGTIVFDANYVQGATGTLHMELAGREIAGTDYDLLQVNGDLSLGGTLALDFISGFAPVAGDEFTLIAIDSSGQLLTDISDLQISIVGLQPGWHYSLDLDTQTNSITLVSLNDAVSVVPEPMASALLILAAGATLTRRRR